VPTNYPSGSDDFHVTTDPANTSLSQGGQNSDGRNHVQAHTDLGDAIEALQEHAALKTHDHSGSTSSAADRASGYKLRQANTHENADTNSSVSALHHTLTTVLPTNGTVDQYKAAPGNHTHDYATLNSTPIRTCTSTTRPTGAPAGTMIVETDTPNSWPAGRVRQLQGGNWALSTAGPTPIVRLRQNNFAQTINKTGSTVLQWNQKLDDNFNCFTVAASAPYNTSITIPESGLYHVEAAIEWAAGAVPENAVARITVGGVNTDLHNSAFFKTTGLGLGIFFSAPFQQTLPLSGFVRLTAGNQVALSCNHDGSTLVGTILSFFDVSSQVRSRLDIRYVAP
jgi:hypothetical protein